ncbi:hypothetical protein [Vibrio sp. SCSIO 43137]|uniref:hypothetical protein n=1 Tax=Vibrio sp. SCSIO 43137 TaxID=3021011 RepID=UPI00230745B6|nr:hypothetical protein [Vibrio sp. SCSIO 43137]WCE28407.1 hypothetical protein PK654_08440 [Vibrio sp. SCSIO 43137]
MRTIDINARLRLAQAMGASLERSLQLKSIVGEDVFGKGGGCELKIVRVGGEFKRAYLEHTDGSQTEVTSVQLIELGYEPHLPQAARGLRNEKAVN